MRAITKGHEPRSLTEHRNAGRDYVDYQDKDGLREALVREQRGLCCYCMGRIRPNRDKMKIEHWRSQAHYPELQLNYRNLLGACPGGKGQPPCLQHCDTRKRDRDLLWNPADADHAIETRVRYLPDGTIKSNDEVFDAQLNEVLNLNLAILKNRRKDKVDILLSWWSGQRKPVPRSRIERKLNEFINGNGELTEYCQVAVWWLQRKLRR